MTHAKAVLLINPDWRGLRKQKQPQFKRIWQPLGLATAAALLENKGFRVKILDNNIERLSPKAIGELSGSFEEIFVTTTPYDRWQCPSLDLSFFFKTIRHIPRTRLYIMGAHVTERPEAILRKSGARAAILHEMELTILKIASREFPSELPDIRGIAYIKGEECIKTPPRGYLDNLDQLPYPAYHLLHMDRYYYELLGRHFAILEGSRGCPYGCSFCYLGMFGIRYRQKSVERLVDETVYVSRRFSIQNIYFMDLEFGLNREFLLSFCREMVRRQVKITWCCQTRVTDVDEETLKWMAMSGCDLIHFGLEAGSDRILSQTGKGINVSDGIRAVSLARKFDIRTVLFMNFGFPGETRSEMEETIALAIRLAPDYVAFHLIVPFPGTPLAREIGVDPEGFPTHLYPHYNYVHHELNTLKLLLKKAYLRFYLRPSYLANCIRKPRRLGATQAALFLRLITG